MSKKEIKNNKIERDEHISRRTAIQKMSYAAFASSTMFLLLNNPTKVYASSTPTGNPDDDFGDIPGGGGGNSGNQNNQNNDPWFRDDHDPWK